MGSKGLDHVIKTVLKYPNLHFKCPSDFGQAKKQIFIYLPHKGLAHS